MTEELRRAKEALDADTAVTLAVCRGDDLTVSREKGIKPLLKLTQGDDLRNASAADRIVGKAAAMLYALTGVKAVFAQVLSEQGRTVLKRYGIVYEYGTLTENIINRAGTGLCPMEEAVKDIDDLKEALAAIKAKVAALAKG